MLPYILSGMIIVIAALVLIVICLGMSYFEKTDENIGLSLKVRQLEAELEQRPERPKGIERSQFFDQDSKAAPGHLLHAERERLRREWQS